MVQKLPAGHQDGKVSENDVEKTVYWLKDFPSNSRAETLSGLISYTQPTDANFVNRFLQETNLVEAPIDQQNSGLFTPAGDQVSTIEGARALRLGRPWMPSSKPSLTWRPRIVAGTITFRPWLRARGALQMLTGEIDALVKALQELPSDPTNPATPPLVSAAEARDPALRERLTSSILLNVIAGIQEKIGTIDRPGTRGMVKGKEKGLLISDIDAAFKAAGVSDVDVCAGGNDLLITRRTGPNQEIPADGLKITSSGGKFYLGTEAILRLNEQLAVKMSKSVMDVLDQRGARGQPAPDLSEVNEVRASIEKTLGPGSDPDPRTGPKDPKLGPGDPDGPGEKK